MLTPESSKIQVSLFVHVVRNEAEKIYKSFVLREEKTSSMCVAPSSTCFALHPQHKGRRKAALTGNFLAWGNPQMYMVSIDDRVTSIPTSGFLWK